MAVYRSLDMEPLASERVVVSAPMSLAGSRARLWALRRHADAIGRAGLNIGRGQHPAARVALLLAVGWVLLLAAAVVYVALVAAIPLAWAVIVCWYLLFGLLLVPYRLIRRSSRKGRRDALRHREVLSEVRRQGG
jgi:hypothetical protein